MRAGGVGDAERVLQQGVQGPYRSLSLTVTGVGKGCGDLQVLQPTVEVQTVKPGAAEATMATKDEGEEEENSG